MDNGTISIFISSTSLILAFFFQVTKYFNMKSFKEYFVEISGLLDFIHENNTNKIDENVKKILKKILKKVYCANLFILKNEIVRAALMYLFEHGEQLDIPLIRRAQRNMYLWSFSNRSFAQRVIEKLEGNNPYLK